MTMILNKNRWMGFMIKVKMRMMTRVKMRMMIMVKMRMTTSSRGTWSWSPSNWRGRTNRRPAYPQAHCTLNTPVLVLVLVHWH